MDDYEDLYTPERPWKLWASGALIGVVVLLGIWLLLSPPNTDTEQAAPDAETEAAASQEISETADPENEEEEEGCPSDMPVNDEIPSDPPAVRWELFRTLPLPFSDEHGPLISDDLTASCFSQTPTGALLAHEHAISKTLTSDDRTKSLQALTVENEGQKVRAESIAEQGDIEIPEPLPGQLCKTTGFRFVDYTPEKAIIEKATRCSGGDIQISEATLVWDQDQATWLLQLADDGGTTPRIAIAVDLSGFVVWGGA